MANDNQKTQVLIATGDMAYGGAVQSFLEAEHYDVFRCADSGELLRLLGPQAFDVLILDLEVPGVGDLDLISFMHGRTPDTQVILIFDVANVERAIEGIHKGAFFYLPKSSPPSDVSLIVRKAVKALESQMTIRRHEKNIFKALVGETPAMKRVLELVSKVAPTDSTVLLLGESGTGKEVIANTIHRLSPRRDDPFIAINCAALPENILESELFGHAKGAFTGAEADKAGLFEEADGGTLFLDEVADMALSAQAKLLRVLQNGEIRRVGDSNVRHVDVRILAATNHDLLDDVHERRFREDLYFRLNVIQIVVPPLRERRDAIPALVDEFLQRFNRKFRRSVVNIDEHAWNLILNYEYPGNVRELESIIAHAVILAEGDTIETKDLPDQIRFGRGVRLSLPNLEAETIPTLQEMEKQLIEASLRKLNGNQTEVAKRMGISRSTLWRKMKEYDISVPGEEQSA